MARDLVRRLPATAGESGGKVMEVLGAARRRSLLAGLGLVAFIVAGAPGTSIGWLRPAFAKGGNGNGGGGSGNGGGGHGGDSDSGGHGGGAGNGGGHGDDSGSGGHGGGAGTSGAQGASGTGSGAAENVGSGAASNTSAGDPGMADAAEGSGDAGEGGGNADPAPGAMGFFARRDPSLLGSAVGPPLTREEERRLIARGWR